jgi:transglutaminase-like putative cysteine protease
MAPRRSTELAVLALAALSVAAALTLGRVFDSGGFALPVAGAAALPHALGLMTRRRGWPVSLTVTLSLVGIFAYAVWVIEPSTTRYGLPTSATLDTLARHLEQGYDELRTAVVPAPVSDGALLLAVVATWVMAQTADLLAFRRDATIAAVAPALSLFIWASALGSAELRARTTIGFAGAAMVFLLLQHQALLERRRAWFAGRRLGVGTGLVSVGALVGTVAVLGGVVVGPALPGADSEALIDVKGLGAGGGGGRGYRAEPPLARIGENFLAPERVNLFSVRSPVPEYWRIAALDRYTSDEGGQWTLTARGSDEVAEGLHELDGSAGAVQQDFHIRALEGRWMPAAYRAVDVEGGDALVVRDSTTLVTSRETVRGLQYSVRSEVQPPPETVSEARRRATDRRPPPDLAEFTELADDFPQDVRRLAEEVVAGAQNPYERAGALEQFFDPANGFEYSLDADVSPQAQSESAIREFVFESRRGFCVQFAGSFAAMARAVGLPARMAVGFAPGTSRPDGTFRVTSWDAHAWPEVWLAGLGWTRFEPTPRSDLPGGSDLPGRAADTGPGGAGTEPGATPTTAAAPSAAPGAGAPPTVAANPSTNVSIDAPGAPDEPDDRKGLITFSWALLAAVVAGLVVLTAVGGGTVVVVKARSRARRRARPDPADAITGAWEEALDRLGEAGVARRAALTPLELAADARRRVPESATTPLRSLAETYTATRYGPRPPGVDAADLAWERMDEISRALRDDAPLRERWRRRLDPSPLRERR